MSIASFAFIAAGSLAAGFIQSMSGFGAGTIMAIIFSLIPGITQTQAAAMTLSVCFPLTIYLALKYRKYFEWKLIVLPLIPYLIVSTVMNLVMKKIDGKLLPILFGVFQIILAVYYLFVSAAIKPRKDAVTGITIGGVSGATAALFGVGGPFLSIYMVAVSSSAKSYTANLQLLFVITNIFILSEKLAMGHYPFNAWYYTIAGIVAIIAGARLGVILINKIDIEKMKKIVYWFLLVSGVATILQAVL